MLNAAAAILVALLATTSAAPVPDAQVAALKQRIWASFSDVDTQQGALPPGKRATGLALQALYGARRAPVVSELWRVGAAAPKRPGGLQALGLVVAWGEPPLAQQALDLATRTHGDDDALAPQLEAGYDDSRAPRKRDALVRLAASSRSRSVRGSSLFLLARASLAAPSAAEAARERAEALSRLRRVVAAYGSEPTTLLAAGSSGRLGPAAAALLFEEERLAVGARLPPMHAHDLEGHPVSSNSLSGRYTLIDFWATWCPPCVAAFPALADMQRHHGERLHLVSISADASSSAPSAFVRKEGATWTQWYVGPSGTVSPEWTNGTFPYFLLVGPNGRILAAERDVTRLRAAVDRNVR